MTAPRLAVLGLGNVLLGDDGVGPFVVELLRAGWTFPDGVAVTDVGTPGLGLLTYVHGADVVILVDAVKADGPPGAVRVYRGPELSHLPVGHRVSPHDPAVVEVLSIAAFDGAAPREVVLVGIIPDSVALGAGMSPRVRAGAAAAVGVVLAELERQALAAAPVRGITDPDVWWLRPPSRASVHYGRERQPA